MPNWRERALRTVLRRYPFLSGRGTLANLSALRWLAAGSNDETWAAIPGGQEVCAPLGDYVGRAIYFTGDLDPKVTWLCSRFVAAGDTAIDVGANLGLVTALLAQRVGTRGRVHAFEPNPVMQQRIERAIERNRLSQVTLHRCALGAEQSRIALSIPRGNAGAASLVPVGWEQGRASVERIEVSVRPLSSFGHEIDFSRVGFVKIDVEGFEKEVLRGALDVFARSAPDAILFESNRGRANHDEILALLRPLGYEFYDVPRRLLRRMIVRARPGAAGERGDCLAVRTGSPAEATARSIAAR